MKLVKQQGSECALASVCMAKDKAYRAYSRAFHQCNGFMFGDAAGSRRRPWLILANNYLEAVLGVKVDWFRGYTDDFKPYSNQHISLAGQGVISVIKFGFSRHTIAFSQGRIYDPQESYLANWRDWQRHNPDWLVYDLTLVEK